MPTDRQRLDRIARIIEAVDTRCMAVDGPVPPTLQEMTQQEISAIYALANGQPEDWRPDAPSTTNSVVYVRSAQCTDMRNGD